MPLKRKSWQQRTGLSIMEFLACAVAVIGGAWLGALYLGVDVNQLAYTSLAEAHLLDRLPPQLRPADAKSNVLTHKQLVTSLHQELGSLRNQIAALHSGGEATASPNLPSPADTNATSQSRPSKEKTLAYWLRLNKIVARDAELQYDAESAANSSNAAKVFAVLGRIRHFSAKAVEALPADQIDESLLCFGRQLAQWYARGGDLCDRAVRVLESPTGQQARADLDEEWKKAEAQHQNEEKLLYQNATAVRNSLSRIYGLELPEFNKPVEPASPKNS
ncbi:MAG TPA: hypothetical protein VFW73_01030 [Lacipirellulaceae bacterium]|nr:hypothetical protein [Lacipirellulaceae bacterium]